MDAHILAVDDNPEIREIIEILLINEGFAVDQAGDVHTGARHVDKKSIMT